MRTAAWESLRFARSAKGLGGPTAGHQRGEPPMENALLIGLSRHITLERQIDVVANNIANINTTGFKADRSLFQEYLRSGAHEDNFVGQDRRVSFVTDGLSYHDFTQAPTE